MNTSPNLKLRDIRSAQEKIQPYIRTTPVEYSHALSERTNSAVYLKLENWQKTGSFKLRGALNKLLSLSPEEKHKGVITASAGNHGLGVALAAKLLGVQGKIVVPVNASLAKLKALQQYHLEVIQKGEDYDEAEQFAWELQQREALTFIHAFSDLEIIAGQGTIGLEILAELPDVKTVVVPIGGGGLISGIAVAVKSMNPKVKIIGVQSEASPAMYHAIHVGKVVETPIEATIADGLAGRFVTELTLSLTQEYVDDIVLVSEPTIEEALLLILESEHMLVEGSAAVGVAALLENKITSGDKTIIVLTGSNVDIDLLKSLL
ncbi:MAG: threonine/serine dehydratase [bacterium]